jgi:hypothetical protein
LTGATPPEFGRAAKASIKVVVAVMFDPIAVRPDQLLEVRTFLAERFNVSLDADFLEPNHTCWKYFASRPDWGATRSYILRMENGCIGAHACVCPITVWTGEHQVSGYHISDRAGHPKAPGWSFLLTSLLAPKFDVLFAIGGNTQSLRMARADRSVTYYGTCRQMTRVLRPFRKCAAHKPTSWKTPLHLGRDLLWDVAKPLPAPGSWTAEPVDRFDGRLPTLDTSRTPRHFLPMMRTPELLNYMLQCPGAHFRGYLLRSNGAARGHLLLSGKYTEARIADLTLASDEAADWVACYGLAARLASEAYPAAFEVSAAALPPFVQAALRSAGFRHTGDIPVFLADKRNLVSGRPLLTNLNFMDWDGAYLF